MNESLSLSTDTENNQQIEDTTTGTKKHKIGHFSLETLKKRFARHNIENQEPSANAVPESLRGVNWQKECYEKIQHERNVILSAPTGSGKTRVFMEWAKEKQKEAIAEGTTSTIYITAPIKALSNQRYRELESQGYKVGLETGDIKNVPRDADIICCTQEIFTNKYCNDPDATLIVDEFHYMFENPDRQRAYIDGIHNAKAKNILTCSATMGNLDKTVSYVNKISGRDFTSYETKERLTTLDFFGDINPSDIKNALVVAFSKNNINGIVDQLTEIRADNISDQADSKQRLVEIEKIAQKYKTHPTEGMQYGIASYYSSMLPKEKLFVEELFEKKLLDTIVGTDALALGVNFPIENVVFSQLMKYRGPHKDALRLSKNQFDQLCGRAGRKGYFDHGKVYYCTELKDSYGRPTEAKYLEGDGYYHRRQLIPYDTAENYGKLLNAENEDISVKLQVNMRNLLSDKTTAEDEAKYIVNFSTEYDDKDLHSLQFEIESRISSFKEYVEIAQEYITNRAYTKEFFKYLPQVYDETVPVMSSSDNDEYQRYRDVDFKNTFLLKHIILDYFNKQDDKPYSTQSLFGHYVVNKNSFRELMQFRQYMHALPKKYRRMYDLAGLDNVINSIDDTALNTSRDLLKPSDIDAPNASPDLGLLVFLYGFEAVEKEVYNAISSGKESVDSVFKKLDTKSQIEHLKKIMDNFNGDLNNMLLQIKTKINPDSDDDLYDLFSSWIDDNLYFLYKNNVNFTTLSSHNNSAASLAKKSQDKKIDIIDILDEMHTVYPDQYSILGEMKEDGVDGYLILKKVIGYELELDDIASLLDNNFSHAEILKYAEEAHNSYSLDDIIELMHLGFKNPFTIDYYIDQDRYWLYDIEEIIQATTLSNDTMDDIIDHLDTINTEEFSKLSELGFNTNTLFNHLGNIYNSVSNSNFVAELATEYNISKDEIFEKVIFHDETLEGTNSMVAALLNIGIPIQSIADKLSPLQKIYASEILDHHGLHYDINELIERSINIWLPKNALKYILEIPGVNEKNKEHIERKLDEY